ncbi:UbiA-like polyprenyltransferase [Desulfococcaceae bacterium HSG7]|nr:UbiA-like polyprenyltransferase [Desulfococcaceae bacterium HSG7]
MKTSNLDNGHRIHKIINRVTTYGRMIKFSHTIFALPFALTAVVLAGQQYPIKIATLLWILVAMAGARSAAMGFNRLADATIDAQNPRTAIREIPSGLLSPKAVVIFVILSSAVFILACALLGRLCLILSLPVLLLLFAYSYTKRFTWLAHLYLGFAIGLAPLGAWIAVTDSYTWPVLTLCLSLMTYIAGFDILYACQDKDFDRDQGLYSIPAKFGIKRALMIAKILHLISWCFFLSVKYVFDLSYIYLIVAFVIGILLIVEHRLVKPDDLRHINIAFFHINSVISITLFLGVLCDVILGVSGVW